MIREEDDDESVEEIPSIKISKAPTSTIYEIGDGSSSPAVAAEPVATTITTIHLGPAESCGARVSSPSAARLRRLVGKVRECLL